MSLNDNILNVMEWHEKIIDLSDGKAFMLYLNDFLNEQFGDIKKRHLNFSIEFEPHEITVSIFHDKFIARLEGKEVKFYKKLLGSKEFELLGLYSLYAYSRSHQLFDKSLRQFHTDYINLMLEDAFSRFSIINEKINKREYWLT